MGQRKTSKAEGSLMNFIRMRELEKKLDLKKSKLYEMIKDGFSLLLENSGKTQEELYGLSKR